MFNFGMIPELSTKHNIVFECGCEMTVSYLGYRGHIKLCPLLSHAFHDMHYTAWGLDKVPRVVRGTRIWIPQETRSIDFERMLC